MAEPVSHPDRETELYATLRKEGKSEEMAARMAAKAAKLDPTQVGQDSKKS